MNKKFKLGYIVSHPIQYQAPLLKELAKDKDIELKVLYCSDFSVRGYVDEGFGRKIEWDIPLLEGYNYEFLPELTKTNKTSFWKPLNYGIYKVLRRENFDALWIHGYFRLTNLIIMLLAKIMGIKVFVRDDTNLIRMQRSAFKKIMKRLFFKILDKLCDGFLVVGQLNKEYYLHYGIKPEKLSLVPWAVDNEFIQRKVEAAAANREQLKESLGLKPNRPIILFVGKLISEKRPADLLHAYRLMSPDGITEPLPYLIFVGDGKEREALELAARNTGWSSIKFLGFKNQTELPLYYDLCDVLVLPSSSETWGLVVNEAMNAKKAIIVSKSVGCAPDLVKDSVNGYIFNTGDIENLKQCLINLCTNTNLCKEMGQKSFEIINQWSFKEDILGLKEAISKLSRN